MMKKKKKNRQGDESYDEWEENMMMMMMDEIVFDSCPKTSDSRKFSILRWAAALFDKARASNQG